jgi:hypothetical protein
MKKLIFFADNYFNIDSLQRVVVQHKAVIIKLISGNSIETLIFREGEHYDAHEKNQFLEDLDKLI